uniref:Uncharacterized protein n=1 Tax=Acrobeloides nanus TaxID=290746 RepID=A0A914EC15_9BILA
MCSLEGLIGLVVNICPLLLPYIPYQFNDIQTSQIFILKIIIILKTLFSYISYYVFILDCFATLLIIQGYKLALIHVLKYPYKLYHEHANRITTIEIMQNTK